LLHTPWRVPTSVATVLLSGAIDTFLWDLMSVDSGTSAPAFAPRGSKLRVKILCFRCCPCGMLLLQACELLLQSLVACLELCDSA